MLSRNDSKDENSTSPKLESFYTTQSRIEDPGEVSETFLTHLTDGLTEKLLSDLRSSNNIGRISPEDSAFLGRDKKRSVNRTEFWGGGWSSLLKILSLVLIIGILHANSTVYVIGLYSPPGHVCWQNKRLYVNTMSISLCQLSQVLKIVYVLYNGWRFFPACLRVLWAARKTMKELPYDDAADMETKDHINKVVQELLYHMNGICLRIRPYGKDLYEIKLNKPTGDPSSKGQLESEACDEIHDGIRYISAYGLNEEKTYLLTVAHARDINEEYRKNLFKATKQLQESELSKGGYYRCTPKGWFQVLIYGALDWDYCIERATREEWNVHPVIVIFRVYSVLVVLRNL
ncbi:hypothetical protein JCM33374_g6491 [Metschnikowia sp. JCM 33374]|nr:hypothetical protein JCM33374_g6491 [Metschnikowia sp. JCM 33374]